MAADRQLSIVLQLQDEVSNKLKSVGGSFDGLKGQLDKAKDASMAFGATLLGLGAGAVAFGATAVSAYNEAEAAQKQLEHAVLQVSHANKEQLDSTAALADELERKGVLDGDNIKIGLAQLSTFGLSNDAVQKLGGSLADLAVNQFGVNATGDQLSQTANTVAKALNGQFGVLEKSGIRFTDLQKNMIMTGTEMEKVQAINEGLAQNLKYTNDVAMQTGEGLKAHLMVQLGNLQEAIGQALSGGVNQLLVGLSQWIDKAGGVEGIMAMLNDKLNVLKDNAPLIGTVILTLLVPALYAMAGGIIAATAPLLPFLAAGLALGFAVQALVNHFGGVQGALQALQPVFDGLANFFNTVLKPAFDLVWGVVQSLWQAFLGFLPTLQAVWEVLSAAFAPILGELFTLFQSLWGMLQSVWAAFQMLWDLLSPILMPVLEALGVILGATIVVALAAVGIAIQAVIVVITAIVQAITALITWVTNWVKSFDGLKANIIAWWNSVLTTTKSVGDAIGAAVKVMWDFIKGVFQTAFDAISLLATGWFTALKMMFNLFDTAAGAIWGQTWDGIKDKVGSVFEGVKGTVKEAINWIIDKLNFLIEKANSVSGSLSGIGINIPAIPSIPRLAKGGIVTKPTIAMIGEAGAEAVVPLSQAAGTGFGGGITINMNGNFYGGAEEIAEMLLDKIKERVHVNI